MQTGVTGVGPMGAALLDLGFGRVLSERSQHVAHLADGDLLVPFRIEVAEHFSRL